MCVTKNAQTNCQCVSSQFIASKSQETHSRGNTEVLVFFCRHSTRMYLMKEKQGGPILTGLKRWPLRLINHLSDTTVKPAVAATSIKRDPLISGHFRAPRTIFNANTPLLSVHLSNAASSQRNSPQNAESVSLNGHLLAARFIKFHRFLTFLHRSDLG